MNSSTNGAARIQIICTLGPASLDADVIRGLDEKGVDLFRINLSHTPMEKLRATIEHVRRHSDVPISIDTQGAQVRSGLMQPGVTLSEGAFVELVAADLEGSAERLTLWPSTTFDALEPGAEIGIDFHGATLRVVDTRPGAARAVVERGGAVGSNKAVTIDPAPELPPLTEYDVAAIALGAVMGIEHYALSFASSLEAVRLIRSLMPPGARLISKIESRMGIRHMDDIIEASDAILVDRGDLSREVPVVEVPYFQKTIVRRVNRFRRPLFVATNLLESMVLNRRPTVAEVNDIANTLMDGAHGLVLAAETAIGVDPVGAVELVQSAVEVFEREHLGRIAALDARVPELM